MEKNKKTNKKTLSYVRLVWVVLTIIAILTCTVNAAGVGKLNKQYKSDRKDYKASITQQEQEISENESKISSNAETVNKIENNITDNNKKASELREQVNKLSNYTDGKVCYLTFDDGPSNNTLKILDILKKYNAKATFFVTSLDKVEYMKKIADSGNQLALHTYCHDYSKVYASTDAYFSDLKKIHDLVYDKTGVDAKVIRFPGGSSNTISRHYSKGIMSKLTKMVEDRGYAYFDWNVDSQDASGNNVPVSKLVASVKANAVSNRICVLMHDTAAKGTTVEALPQIIQYLADKGYSFEVLTTDVTGFHQGVNN